MNQLRGFAGLMLTLGSFIPALFINPFAWYAMLAYMALMTSTMCGVVLLFTAFCATGECNVE